MFISLFVSSICLTDLLFFLIYLLIKYFTTVIQNYCKSFYRITQRILYLTSIILFQITRNVTYHAFLKSFYENLLLFVDFLNCFYREHQLFA